jgi:hypothetical protein
VKDLFDDDTFNWANEWVGMPEYVQENQREIASVTVHFLTVEAMKEFSELIGKNITFQTKGLVFPVIKTEKKVWVDES